MPLPSPPPSGLASIGPLPLWLVGCLLIGCSPQVGGAQDSDSPESAEETDSLVEAASEADGPARDEWHIPLDAPVGEDARDAVGRLIEATRPLDPTLTSDYHDRHLAEQRQLIEGLKVSEEEIGNAALHAYTGAEKEPYLVRRALIWVGGFAAPESARELLRTLMMNYGFPIDDRTEATIVLAKTSPEVFLASAAAHLRRREKPTQTMPDDEFLVEGWVDACQLTGQSPVPMLADVATNLLMQPRARYLAAKRMRLFPNEPIGQEALESCLVESMGDGYLRRMAAQSLRELLPRETGCRLFAETLARESDLNFRQFLNDMIQENCRGELMDDSGAAPIVSDDR